MLDNKMMTMHEIGQWLSKCFEDGLKKNENFHDQLCATVEALSMQGALDDHTYTRMVDRLTEQMILLGTIPKPKGWRVKIRWQNDSWCITTTFPEIFLTYEDARIKSSTFRDLQADKGKLTILTNTGHKFSVLDKSSELFAILEGAEPIKEDFASYDIEHILYGSSQELGYFGLVIDILPIFQLYGDDKFAIVMANNGLQELEQRFAVTQKEVVDELIESSCCSELPGISKYIGHKGTPQERLEALRQVLINAY